MLESMSIFQEGMMLKFIFKRVVKYVALREFKILVGTLVALASKKAYGELQRKKARAR